MREDAKMEQIRVTIENAVPSDALSMAQLKFENLMHRASNGELEMSPEDVEHAQVTEESVRKLAEMLAQSNEDDYYLVAKTNGEIAGFCRMTWGSESQQFQFQQFYVSPKLMGKKIGGKIMAAAKERARGSSHEARGIFLYTGDYNGIAQNIYEHWGFKRLGAEESKFDQRGDRKIEWVKMMLDF